MTCIFPIEYVEQSRSFAISALRRVNQDHQSLKAVLGIIGAHHLESGVVSYEQWATHFGQDLALGSPDLHVIAWSGIPDALKMRAGEVFGGQISQNERATYVLAFREQMDRWKDFETARNQELKRPATENNSLASIQALSEKKIGAGRNSAAWQFWKYSIPALFFMAWLFSPMGPLPAILVLILIGLQFFLFVKHRPSTMLSRIILLLVVFVIFGILNDAFWGHKYTALCVDGSYSSSRHHSGTCSWHGGVAEWNPRTRYWWQSLLGISN